MPAFPTRSPLVLLSVAAGALALGACRKDLPPAPPAPPTAADDSLAQVLADTATAGERYVGRRRTLSGEGNLVRVWLRPDGRLVWAEDALNGGPLAPQRGTYEVKAGAAGADTLLVTLTAADSVRFVRTPDSLLETRRDTLVKAHLLRLVRHVVAVPPHPPAPPAPRRAPSTNTPGTPEEAAQEAVREAAREADRLPAGSARPRQ